MNTTTLFNPLEYGRVTLDEAEKNGASYTRNGKNEDLREFMKEKFSIPDDNFYFSEISDSIIAAINRGTTIVRTQADK